MLSRVLHGRDKRKADGSGASQKDEKARRDLKAEIKSVGLTGPAKQMLLDAYQHCGTADVPAISVELAQTLGEFRSGRYGGEATDTVVADRVRTLRRQPHYLALWGAFEGDDKADPYNGQFGGLTEAATAWQRVAAYTFLVEVYALKVIRDESMNVHDQREMCADSIVCAITGGPAAAYRLWDPARKAFVNGAITPVGNATQLRVATQAAAPRTPGGGTQALPLHVPAGAPQQQGLLAPGGRPRGGGPGAPDTRGGCNFCKVARKPRAEILSHREEDCPGKKALWAAKGWK